MIANYSTTIPTAKTVGEIQQLLGAAGARAIQIDYEGGEAQAIAFGLEIQGKALWYRLPFRPQGILKTLIRDKVPRRLRTEGHARRVGARIVKDWVRAQLAIVDAGQAELGEVMMPYLVDETGVTLWQRLLDGRLALPAAPEEVLAELAEEAP